MDKTRSKVSSVSKSLISAAITLIFFKFLISDLNLMKSL